MCPGSNESAGKRPSGRTRRGNGWRRSALVAAAQSAIRSRTTSFAAQYRRLKARRGAQRAILAVAHAMLVSDYHIVLRREAYCELGADSYNQRRPKATACQLTQWLRRLGFDVIVTPRTEPAP
jgi:hypothetical protein